jgi:two-component system chemotaxis response regulator CheB
MPIKVLVVDDSAVMRALLTEIIGGAADLVVVGSAPDPLEAREMIKRLDPDVLTLDVEMPKMDGLDFLRRLMKLRPMPVVMVSSLTGRGSDTTLQALELGAVDFVGKPRADFPQGLEEYGNEIRDKIRAAHGARVRSASRSVAPKPPQPVAKFAAPRANLDMLIAFGASTGGTEAIKDVIAALPAGLPPIVMVQHMPETFTPSFARRLDAVGAVRVTEVANGERLQAGHAYLAPGHSHLLVTRRGGSYIAVLSKRDPVNRHRPAADVLFQSVADEARNKSIGVILTGMGKDGAMGLLAMKRAGAWNIAQDQESCVVYGMPREAVAIGAIDEVVPLKNVAERILDALARVDAGARRSV